MYRILMCALVLATARSATAITIDTVPVGDAGNIGEFAPLGPIGGVGYEYSIGTYEVTNAQYVAFLNAVAASDPNELYNTAMAQSSRGGILRAGSDGGYTYSLKPNMGNKPVNLVSWFDAARFANWLNNGQPRAPEGNSTTERGAYTLNANSTVAPPPARNPGAVWFLPNESEWYKAAYYDPTRPGSVKYWTYATKSDIQPIMATANSVGDISNPGANVANYNFGANWNSQIGNLTTVGSAGPASTSYYGTLDQDGNVFEWLESTLGEGRGGAWNYPGFMDRGTSDYFNYYGSSEFLGFRIATIVPEPSTFVLTISTIAATTFRRRRPTSHSRV